MSSVLFYTIIIGLTSGIFFRSFFDSSIEGILLVLLVSFGLGAAWRIRKRDRSSLLFIVSVFLLLCGVGMFRFELHDSSVSPLQSRVGETAVYEGLVVREPDVRESSQHLYVREKESEALILVTTDAYASVAYGDHISVRGKLEIPESFETETGRTFNYEGYLKAKGVSEMISFGEVTVVDRGHGNPIMSALLKIKHSFMRKLEQSIPEPAVGLGEGMLLGVKRALGEELSETFRVVGIIHIVVLSGYNIMIVADSVMRVLGYFFFPRTRLILGIASIVLFALLVGFSATVVRASIMAGLVLIARNSGKTYAVLRALCITGVLMLLHNPYLLAFDPGFQLSFLATLGLILISPEFEKRFTYVPTFGGIRGYLATTIGTQLYVLPILLFSMGTLSLVSVLVNVLVLPIVPFAMLATFVVGIVASVALPLGILLGFGAHLVLSYIIKVAELFSLMPYAAVTIPAFPFWLVALMYLGLGIWTWRLTQKTEKSTGDKTHLDHDSYDDWVIEEEKDPPTGTRVPVGGSDPFPFR